MLMMHLMNFLSSQPFSSGRFFLNTQDPIFLMGVGGESAYWHPGQLGLPLNELWLDIDVQGMLVG